MKKILIISLAAFLAACSGKPKDKKEELADLIKQRTELDSKIATLEAEVGTKDSTKTDIKDVSVTEVVQTPFKNYLEIQGKIDAEENVQVNPEAQGVVNAVYAKIGQNVSRGQILAQIDDKVLQQSISELQNQLELAKSLYERQKNLWDQKIGTEVQFLNAKTQKEAAERRIATMRSQISMYKIKAPISGTIDAMDLKVGQAVMPGMSGIKIVNASKLKAKALVSESYVGRVNQGGEVKVILPDLKDSLNTKITFAAKTIDPASRSFNIEIALPSSVKYRPNMLTVLKITDYKNNNAIVLPINTVQKAENGDYVFVVENGKAKRVTVTSGKTSEGKVEILSGLKVGDKVITSGSQELNDGDLVKAI